MTSITSKSLEDILSSSQYKDLIQKCKVEDGGFINNVGESLFIMVISSSDISRQKILVGEFRKEESDVKDKKSNSEVITETKNTYLFKIPSSIPLFYSFRNRISNKWIKKASLLIGANRKVFAITGKIQEGDISFSNLPIFNSLSHPMYIEIEFDKEYKLLGENCNKLLMTLGQVSQDLYAKLNKMLDM